LAICYLGFFYLALCPGQFIVKVPYTPEGLIGARLLHEKGVRINFTLGFSARQNALVTLVAQPDYLNVFLGRIGAFLADNRLGDGSGAGENAVLSSQEWVTRLSGDTGFRTRQIAASLRNYTQLDLLAGTDVFTMPPKVAAAGRKSLSGLSAAGSRRGMMCLSPMRRPGWELRSSGRYRRMLLISGGSLGGSCPPREKRL
jgi:transaldolase